jgi:putative DNA primase/helicase
MQPPSLAWPASADPTMGRDGPFRSPAPLTAIESARRAAALKANQETDQPTVAAVASEMLGEVAAVTDTTGSEVADERLFGRRTALFLSDCRRDVALAPVDTKKIVFQEIAKKIGQAVTGQWLPKTVMMDRLLDIAGAHGSFGLDPEQLQQLMADAVETVRIPQAAQVSAPLKRRLITHRASDVQPEKLVWVWPGRIPEGKLVLVGGPPGLGKSQLTAFMAATISNGGDWPCNEGSTAVGNVIFMSAEDGIEDTIVPRLMAAGANRDRVYIVASATKPDGTAGRRSV